MRHDIKIRIEDYKKEVKWSKKDRPIILAMRKYGFDKFTFTIIDTAETKEELNIKEIFYINALHSLCSEHGYNIELGGNSVGKHAEETKRKISEAQKGDLNHMYGVRGKDNASSKKVIELTTGMIYESAVFAAEDLNLNFSHICACARGKRGSTGGYVFRYFNNDNTIMFDDSFAKIKSLKTKNAVLLQYKQYIS